MLLLGCTLPSCPHASAGAGDARARRQRICSKHPTLNTPQCSYKGYHAHKQHIPDAVRRRMEGFLQLRERFTAGSAARWWQPTFLPASASCSRALSSPASMMHQYRTAQLRLQRLTAVAGAQRLNASTPQRLDASTPRRLNASTQTRQMHGFRPGGTSSATSQSARDYVQVSTQRAGPVHARNTQHGFRPGASSAAPLSLTTLIPSARTARQAHAGHRRPPASVTM